MGTVACCYIFAVVVLLVLVVAVEEEEEYRCLTFYRNRFSVAIAQLNNNDKNYHY